MVTKYFLWCFILLASLIAAVRSRKVTAATEIRQLHDYYEDVYVDKVTGNLFNELLPQDTTTNEYLTSDNSVILGSGAPLNCNITSNQYMILKAFYDALGGPNWIWPTPSSKWVFTNPPQLNAPCHTWAGINCTCYVPGKNFAVVNMIRLEKNRLSGTIPKILGNLTSLASLILNNNYLRGPLPKFLGWPTLHLKRLNLSSNYFTGTVPGTYTNMIGIRELSLGRNSLVGTLPTLFGYLSTLKSLILNQNKFNGTVPDEYSRLNQLVILSLRDNKLQGTIPSFLSTFSSLRYLSFGKNSLSGQIPPFLFQKLNLTLLQLSSNSLTGTFPNEMCNSRNLFYLFLNMNRLGSTIPNCIQQSNSKLLALTMGNNQIYGTIPSNFYLMSQIELLGFASNDLEGPLPSMSLWKDLQYLNVINNRLTGKIPNACFLSNNLTGIWLGNNSFTGTLPNALVSAPRLTAVLVQQNKLTGKLENFNFNYWPKLTSLDLSYNEFSGSFPSRLSALTKLESLSAASNCFDGSLTKSLCAMSSLTVMSLNGLGSNEFCSATETLNRMKPSFMHGFFQGKYMTGSVPSCIFALPQLTTLYLAGNTFLGTIPDFPNTTNLVNVSLNNNRFSGTLPRVMQTHSFLNLDISQNKITGTLEEDFSFGTQGGELKMHTNRISGNIPSGIILTNYTKLDILLGNLFECRHNPSRDVNHVSYSCGSKQLNDASYAWASIFGTMVIAVVIYMWFDELTICLKTSLACLKSFGRHFLVARYWWVTHNSIFDRDFRAKMPHTMLCIYFMHCGTKLSIYIACLMIFFLVPIYVVMKNKYGYIYATVTEQAGWILSCAYMHLFSPVLLIGLAIVWITIVYYLFALRWYKISKAFEKKFKAAKKAKGQNVGIFTYYRRKVFAVLITLILQIINIVVTVAVNALYVNKAIRSNKYDAEQLYTIQAALGAFKFFWNMIYITIAAQAMPISPKNKLNNRLFMSLFSYIAAPCFATLMLNRACFYNIFVLEPSIPTQYDTTLCVSSRILNQTCGTVYTEYFESSFSPAFMYSYQCSSNLLTTFVPVLMYTYIISGVVMPCFYFTLSVMQHHTLENSGFSVKTFFAEIFNVFSTMSIAVSSSSTAVMFTQDITVLLTFGLASPVLAIAIGTSLWAQNVIYRLLIGKEIFFAINYRKDDAKALMRSDPERDSHTEHSRLSLIRSTISYIGNAFNFGNWNGNANGNENSNKRASTMFDNDNIITVDSDDTDTDKEAISEFNFTPPATDTTEVAKGTTTTITSFRPIDISSFNKNNNKTTNVEDTQQNPILSDDRMTTVISPSNEASTESNEPSAANSNADVFFLKVSPKFYVKSLRDIEIDARHNWKALYSNVWSIVFSISFFWAFMFFDMIADVYGDIGGIVFSIVFAFGLPGLIVVLKARVFELKPTFLFDFDSSCVEHVEESIQESSESLKQLQEFRDSTFRASETTPQFGTGAELEMSTKQVTSQA